jgi:hypothetical protein
VGTESEIRNGRLQIADCRLLTADYCREVETYLCRKNDGHLIRIVGPSFDLVSGWAAQGVPLKVACSGIDRYFERYYRKGPRRRPVKIDFCEADILDVFDEWRRALGLTQSSVPSRQSSVSGLQSSDPGNESSDSSRQAASRKRQSLPEHLERVVLRLTSARVSGSFGADFDTLIDRVAAELDAARAQAGGLRGRERQALIDRLSALDLELLQQARRALDGAAAASLAHDADEELAGFRGGMAPEAFARAREAAVDRLVRERFVLPTIAYLQA